MAATAGRKLRVSVATTLGGTYDNVAGAQSATMSRQGLTVDVTELTDDDIKRILGIKDNTFTIEGNYETDTNGQGRIRTAYENDTALFVRFLPDGVTGWKQEVKVARYEISGAAGANKQSVSIELQATGPITVV